MTYPCEASPTKNESREFVKTIDQLKAELPSYKACSSLSDNLEWTELLQEYVSSPSLDTTTKLSLFAQLHAEHTAEKAVGAHRNQDDKPTNRADELAGRLLRLHRDLEDRGDKGDDWSSARALEDRIGAYQPAKGDFEKAEALLAKHGI